MQRAEAEAWKGVKTLAGEAGNSAATGEGPSLERLRRAAYHARLAHILALSARHDPDITVDPFLPPVHIAALYLPPWAPVLAPLLIALVTGLRQWWSKRRKNLNSADKTAVLVVQHSHKMAPLFNSDRPSLRSPSSSPCHTRQYSIRDGVNLTIRPIRPCDVAGVRELYVRGQRAHVHDEASKAVHGVDAACVRG